MSSVTTNFDKQTYTTTNLPVPATLSGDIAGLAVGINDNNTRLGVVEGAYIKDDGTIDFTALESYATDLTPTDDKNLVPKKYVDDSSILKASHNLPDGQGINYQITTSTDPGGTDDLTVSLKTVAGSDPSATDTAYIRSGATILSIATALSCTVTDADHFGWDQGKIQGNDAQLFVYIINNNGTAQLGVSQSSNLRTVATNYYDSGGQTGTAGYANIVMSGTRNDTNSCRVIGRIGVKQADDDDWETPTDDTIIDNPIFETDTSTFTGQLSGGGSLTVAKTATDHENYKIIGDRVFVSCSYTFTTGGTTNASVIINSPVKFGSIGNYGMAVTVDSGFTTGWSFYDTTGDTIIVRKATSANWGIGAGRACFVSLNYPIE